MLRLTPRRCALIFPRVAAAPYSSVVPEQLQTVETGTRFDDKWSMQFHAPLPPPPAQATYGRAVPPGSAAAAPAAVVTRQISPWHHIPLVVPTDRVAAGAEARLSSKVELYYVNEIPRGTREKIECSPVTPFNALTQDRNKDGSLRRFTYGDMPFNYGFLPRTYENPDERDTHTNELGDGDPVDVVFLDAQPVPIGAVRRVRVVGAFALLDQGETDWKLLAVPSDSPVRNVDGVPKEVLLAVHGWFKNYKTTDGKPENRFAFEGRPMDADLAVAVVAECAKQYNAAVDRLRSGLVQVKKEFWIPDAAEPKKK
jgi:inorganic pyrophosphatase